MSQARCVVALAASLSLIGNSGVALAEEIGTSEWVAPRVEGTPPDRPTRELKKGEEVNAKEQVATNERGAVDVVFHNNARLLIGPRCMITLDAVYYDPETDEEVQAPAVTTQEVCLIKADTTAGFSLLYAAASERESVIILQTPVARIHIIDTVAVVELNLEGVDPGEAPEQAGALSATKIIGPGEVEVIYEGETTTLVAAASSVSKPAGVQALSQPLVLSAGQLVPLVRAFEGLIVERMTLEADVALEGPMTGDLPLGPDLALPNPCLDTAACEDRTTDILRDIVEEMRADEPPEDDLTPPEDDDVTPPEDDDVTPPEDDVPASPD